MYLLTVLEAASPRSKCQQRWALSPWLADGHLLPVSWHGLYSVCLCVLVSSYRDTSHAGLEPTYVTSFGLNYLFKVPVSKYSHVLGRIKKTDKSKCWWRGREVVILLHCWWDCSLLSFFFFNNFFKKLINLFLAVLGLRFCARAFSPCGKRGPLFIAVRGPLTIVASLVAEHRLQMRRLSSCGSRA